MNKLKLIVGLILILSLQEAFAQPGGGRGRGGFDPKEMIEREKNAVLKRVPTLTADQTELLNGIYAEYGTSLVEIRTEMRKTRNFVEMRPKMKALREEKDLLIKDVLSDDQFVQYRVVMDKIEKNRSEQRSKRQGERRPVQDDSDTEPNG